MPRFKVKTKALALMEQIVEVEADDAQEAEMMVYDSETEAYHGNNDWKYRGIEDGSTVVEVTPL